MSMGHGNSKTTLKRSSKDSKHQNGQTGMWQTQQTNMASQTGWPVQQSGSTSSAVWQNPQHNVVPPPGTRHIYQYNVTTPPGQWQQQGAVNTGTWQVQQYNAATQQGAWQLQQGMIAPPIPWQAQHCNLTTPGTTYTHQANVAAHAAWQAQHTEDAQQTNPMSPQGHSPETPTVTRQAQPKVTILLQRKLQQDNINLATRPRQTTNQTAASALKQQNISKQNLKPFTRKREDHTYSNPSPEQAKEKSTANKKQGPKSEEKPLALWDTFPLSLLERLEGRQKVVKRGSIGSRILDEIKSARHYADFISGCVWTTEREKILVQLGQVEGDLPDELIKHVIKGYCSQKVHTLNEKYICCCGFVMKQEEVSWHDFENCRSFHDLTSGLKCYHGRVHYPVDLLCNPFDQCMTDLARSQNAETVHDVIDKTWPFKQIFGAEVNVSYLTSFEERYLIHLMDCGLNVPFEIIAHVVGGCQEKPHMINEYLGCCNGFILTKSEFDSHDAAMKDPVNRKNAHIGRVIGRDGKTVRDPDAIDFMQCEVNHKLNDSIRCSHGTLFYSLHGCQSPCKVLCSKRRQEFCVRFTNIPAVRAVYCRLKYKKQTIDSSGAWYKGMRPWEEYLIKQIVKGVTVPIEVISHVLDGHDGCFIGPHRLDKNFGCCNGYILSEEEFMSHDFVKCTTDHNINEELICKKGCVYHISAPRELPSTGIPHLGRQPEREKAVIDIVCPDDVPVPLPPAAPAPPPPDHID